MSPEQLAARNAAVSAGVKRSWQDLAKRARRTAAIRAAWDCPLRCAIMRETIRKVRARS